jgi:hypothetical protein
VHEQGNMQRSGDFIYKELFEEQHGSNKKRASTVLQLYVFVFVLKIHQLCNVNMEPVFRRGCLLESSWDLSLGVTLPLQIFCKKKGCTDGLLSVWVTSDASSHGSGWGV